MISPKRSSPAGTTINTSNDHLSGPGAAAICPPKFDNQAGRFHG